MLVTCGYPDPQYLKISTVATSQTCINLCSLHHSNTTTLATYHQREKCKKPHQENITMATSGIQQSAFAGQTALKQSNEFVRKFGGSGNSRFVMRRTVKSAPQSICFCNITDKLQSKSNIALPPPPPLEALSRRRLSVGIGASFFYGLSPFMARAEENSADKEENDKGVIGAIESLFDPNEKTKSGKVLPKAYLNSARELVKTLRESVNESPDDIAKFRRTADAAKESIREYLGIWRGQQTVVQEESYDVLVKAIRSLADFYSKAGPSAPLPEEVKSQILDYLNTAEEFL